MLGGTLSNLGEYDQCVDIKATDDRRGRHYGKAMFTGQYCALDIKPPLPPTGRYYKLNDVVDELKNFSQGGNVINEAAKTAQFFHFLAMRVGLCVPSGCQASDIEEVARKATEHLYWTVKVKRCEVKEDYDYTPLIISVMTVLCFFGFLMLVGSLLELYHYYAQKKIESTLLQLLACFSLISNFKKLVNTKTSAGSMSCLHGLRFLSITWIILGHTYLNVNFQIFRGLRKATIIQRDFFFQAVVNASVAVDTFFFIGGLLVCYATIKVVKETKKPFNIPLYLMHRLFRLLPVYAMVILFIYLAPILGSGPIWHDSIDMFVDACYKNWWTNILFINNFVNSYEMCLPQSWYIACDMQLYIAALIVLLPILRWPRVGLGIAWMGVVASIIGTAVMTYVYEYPPTMLFVHPDPDQRIAYWANAYFKPYSHAGPYCIGLVIGYLLATRSDLKFSLPVRFLGWCAAIACNMAVLYGVYDWNIGRDPELVETLFYSGFHRVAWTFGLAWVVVNCATGQGGVVNYILSWKCWVPLGRLTYCAYLIHPIVQIAALGNARMNVQTTHYFAVWIFSGHLLITYGSSFAASMLVEAPFMGLEKLLLKRIARKMDVGDKRLTHPEEESDKRNGDLAHENEHDSNGFVARL
ncbi:Nose resistant to fluoxetine protein 6, partial [Stegodyphus mimosarum]